MVASEKRWGYCNRHTLFTRRLTTPPEFRAPQSDCAQRRIEPTAGSAESRSPKTLRLVRTESGLLWQPRFFDRALRSVKGYYEKVEYIHLNPVRADLVQRAEDWPWSSVGDYNGSVSAATGANRILSVDRVLLPADERTRI